MVVIVWSSCMALIGVSVLLDSPVASVITMYDYFRLILPAVLLIGLSANDWRLGRLTQNLGEVIVRRIVALPILTLSMNWLAIFTLTRYRSHHRMSILTLAVLFLVIAIYLIYSPNKKKQVEHGVAPK